MNRLTDALDYATRTRFAAQKSGDRSVSRAARCIRFLGDKPVTRVRDTDLRRMVLAMRSSGLSAASCNRHLSALMAVLAEAGVTGLVVPWQTEPKGRTRWLTAAEVTQLAQACLEHRHGDRVSSLVLFLAETGLRRGEALALTWETIDLDGQRPHCWVITSKNGDARWVPLTPDAVRAARTQHPLGGKGPWHGLSESTVNHVFRAAREAVVSTRGDREIVVHTLRHTCASRLIRAGVSLPIVQGWLGHRSVRSTMRYIHVDQDGLAAAARLLGEQVTA